MKLIFCYSLTNFFWIPARVPRFVKAHDKSRNLAGMTSYDTACYTPAIKIVAIRAMLIA
jgi:hypothetical protein